MEDSTQCPICLECFKDRETASPDICDHVFCLKCLQKWAKQGGGFCPVDRKRFRKIIDLSTSVPIQIKPRKRKKHRTLYDVSVYCEVCNKTSNGETLLLCDCCDLAYHCKCLTPPLISIPAGVWNCPVCVAVSEKIKAKKGITKDVEMIVRDHCNWDSCSSFSDSNSSTSSPLERNDKSSFSGSCSPNPYEDINAININQTNVKFDESTTINDCNNNNQRRSLRKKSLRELYNSEKEMPILKKLRPRNVKKTAYISTDSDSNSFEILWHQREEHRLKKKSKTTSRPFQKTSTATTSASCDSYSHSHNNLDNFVSSEATSTSCVSSFSLSYNTIENFTANNVCTVKSTTSLRSFDLEAESINTDDNLLQNRSKEFQKMPTLIDDNENVVSSNSLTDDISIHEELPVLELLGCNDMVDKLSLTPESSNIDPLIKRNKEKPIFSVFEKLEDEDFSQKKYSDINQAVNEWSQNSKYNFNNLFPQNNNLQDVCILPKAEAMVKKDTISDLSCNSMQKAKILSKELRELEREKWKTYHLRSQQNRKPSKRLQCCNLHSKYKSSNTVNIGKHFPLKKHSESFSQLLSVTNLSWQRKKWDKKATVILKSANKMKEEILNGKRNKCGPNYTPHIHNLKYDSHSSTFDDPIECETSHYPNDIISVKSKNMLQLKQSESELLGAVICLPNINQLALRKDGTLFVDWQSCKS